MRHILKRSTSYRDWKNKWAISRSADKGSLGWTVNVIEVKTGARLKQMSKIALMVGLDMSMCRGRGLRPRSWLPGVGCVCQCSTQNTLHFDIVSD